MSSIFLYDVTSSYFEGQHNELAEAGYNRVLRLLEARVASGSRRRTRSTA